MRTPESVRSEFFRAGLVVFEPDAGIGQWLTHTRTAIQTCTFDQSSEGWRSAHGQAIAFPPHACVRQFLSDALMPHHLPGQAQVAVVEPGYPVGGDAYLRSPHFKRHVDGAQSAQALDWAQVLVGVLLTDLRSEDCGNPIHWEGSHFATEMYLQHLPTLEAAAAAAAINQGFPLPHWYQPKQLKGTAGTVFVVHHALHHGIAPNSGPHERQVVYYRIKVTGISDAPWLLWSGFKPLL